MQALSSGAVADANRAANEPCRLQTTDILREHGLGEHVKERAEQLTQDRVDASDVVVCMNQRVFDQSQQVVRLPSDTVVWDIGDWTDEAHPPATSQEKAEHTELTLNRLKKHVDQLLAARMITS